MYSKWCALITSWAFVRIVYFSLFLPAKLVHTLVDPRTPSYCPIMRRLKSNPRVPFARLYKLSICQNNSRLYLSCLWKWISQFHLKFWKNQRLLLLNTLPRIPNLFSPHVLTRRRLECWLTYSEFSLYDQGT